MEAGRFDVYDGNGLPMTPIPTPEDSVPMPSSIYGSTKLMQEYLLAQSELSCPHVVLRLQNVYGPGQSLKNPYTGVLSIFCQQARDGARLNIYEDGDIFRDFVFVDDVAEAFAMACIQDKALGHKLNIGSGVPLSIRSAAETILARVGRPRGAYDITGTYRLGDVRYAVADISRARNVLGWSPRTSFEQGAKALVDWAQDE
jgi:dTDP-L-rhamnose 4-epimerase